VVHNLDKLGELLDRLVSLGANEMAGLSFDVSQAEKLRDEARKEAVANAQRRAKLYADAAGVQLGEVVSIDEGGGNTPRPIFAGRALKADAVPIERGSETLEATVSVTWALK
ncbi:MAG TPA: SIMPL domain-containing protein, partial [Hyphomicrobium sp.]|nr:SIMPL domain-containing protein [Hyphomicrobium sp.]